MGGLSVGWVIKFMGGIKQNWAGQCEIVDWVGLSYQRSLLIPAGGLGVLFRIF